MQMVHTLLLAIDRFGLRPFHPGYGNADVLERMGLLKPVRIDGITIYRATDAGAATCYGMRREIAATRIDRKLAQRAI